MSSGSDFKELTSLKINRFTFNERATLQIKHSLKDRQRFKQEVSRVRWLEPYSLIWISLEFAAESKKVPA